MEDDSGLGIRNWGYYEQSLKGNLGLQLMSSVVERDTKPLLSGRDSAFMVNGGYLHRDCSVPGPHVSMEFMRDGWINQREKLYNVFPGHHSFATSSESLGSHSLQNPPPPNPSKDECVLHTEDMGSKNDGPLKKINQREKLYNVFPGQHNFAASSESLGSHSLQNLPPPNPVKGEPVLQTDDTGSKKDGPLKKRSTGRAYKPPKAKMTKRNSAIPKEQSNCSVPRTKAVKSTEVVINGIDMDIAGIPIPVCSCTGAPQQCYRWGCGGWQSACCTTTISNYPLPLSTKRRGARIAGRKMSQGAFKKVLEKLAGEGHNLSNPIDLKTHWAKHGTNKFVTIK